MSAIADNLQAVQARIAKAAAAAGRSPESVRLLAVSKTWPLASVIEAADAGQRAFGENYVQEGIDKIAAISGRNLEWHFIGPLQSNKSKAVAEAFDWVHSIDRLKIAERLSAQRPAYLTPLQVCVQVNVSGEASKSGCRPDETLALCRAVAALPGLNLRGLMAIPEPSDDPAAQRAPFRQLREIFNQIRAAGLPLDTLSMGMSHDLEAAVAEGATIVRIGTAIFGERNYA
jgi:pyridoxal phosphate enzyme (YggS family)